MTNTTDEWLWTDIGAAVRNPDYVAPVPDDHMALLKQCGEALMETTDFMERHSNRYDGQNDRHPALVVEKARAALEALRKAGVSHD